MSAMFLKVSFAVQFNQTVKSVYKANACSFLAHHSMWLITEIQKELQRLYYHLMFIVDWQKGRLVRKAHNMDNCRKQKRRKSRVRDSNAYSMLLMHCGCSTKEERASNRFN